MTAVSIVEDFSTQPGSVLDGFSMELTARDAHRIGAAGGIVPAGTIVSIPHLPGEENSPRIAAACALRDQGYEPLPHVALRRFEAAAQLEAFLAALADAQVDRLLLLAGDFESRDVPFPDTATMLRSGLLNKYGIRHVAVAGHPEGHPKVDRDVLAAALHEKRAILEDLGLEWSILTQFAFSAEPVLRWVDAVRRDGIGVPIRIGLPGPASVRTLLRFAAICGVGASTSVLKKYGLSVTQLLSSAGPDHLVADYARLIDRNRHGETRMHFYPFGGIEKTIDWIERNHTLR